MNKHIVELGRLAFRSPEHRDDTEARAKPRWRRYISDSILAIAHEHAGQGTDILVRVPARSLVKINNRKS